MRRAAGRIGLALTAVGLAVVLAWLPLRDSDANPALLEGEARADVRDGVFEVTPPYFVAVYRGDPNGPEAGTDPVAEVSTEGDGRFVLRTDMSRDEMRNVYLYVSACGYEPACAYVELPPPRRGEEAWVDTRTGARLNVELKLREPRRSGVHCD